MKGKCSDCDHDIDIHDYKIGCKEDGPSGICPCLNITEYKYVDDVHGVALWECKKCGIRIFDFDTVKHSNLHNTKPANSDVK